MTLTVAIASECDAYDGEVYRLLLEMVVAKPVAKWTGAFRFSGCNTVARQCGAFLASAAGAGVDHAVLAIDNDGGGRKRPEHQTAHSPAVFDPKDDSSCRECWLTAALSPSWTALPRRSCVVVPVQTIETWLLTLRAHPFAPTPEQTYHRRVLKKHFFGGSVPPEATRVSLARREPEKPGALAVLRERPSFRRFEERVSGW